MGDILFESFIWEIFIVSFKIIASLNERALPYLLKLQVLECNYNLNEIERNRQRNQYKEPVMVNSEDQDYFNQLKLKTNFFSK